MTDYRKKKRWKRGPLVVFACSAVVVLQMRTRKCNSKETGGSSLFCFFFVFSVSLLKDFIEVLVFLCGIAQLVCTWLKESCGTLSGHLCFSLSFLFSFMASPFLGPWWRFTSLTHDKYASAMSPRCSRSRT